MFDHVKRYIVSLKRLVENKNIFFVCLGCTFEKFDGPVRDKGDAVGFKMGINLDECKQLCNDNNECQSFVYQIKKGKKPKKGCYLKDKELIGTEPLVKVNPNFFSVRKICKKGNRKYFAFFCFIIIKFIISK